MAETTSFVSERWEDLTLANNFIFCKVMEANPDLCKHLLELLLHIEIDHLEQPKAEHVIKESVFSKSVRFDVYVKDKNRIFDIEMQTVSRKNIPKRARYYQSILDVSNLNAGVNYSCLKDTYIIFLCLDDLFKKGLPIYSFENMCNEDKNIKLNDGSYKYFFNAKNCDKMNSREEKNFFNFLRGKAADDEFTYKLDEKVTIAKQNLEWRSMYMTIKDQFYDEIEEAYNEAYEKAKIELKDVVKDEVRAEIKRSSAKNFLLKSNLSVEMIAECCSLPVEEVLALKKELAS